MVEPDTAALVTPDEVAKLDAAYEPFPTFAAWTHGLTVRTRELSEAIADLEAVAGDTTPDHLDAVRERMMRAAAWDTGAIENLYETDRGVTMTVAAQAASWEATAAGQGENALELFAAQLSAYELVLDLATENQQVSEAIIRRIHSEVTEPQETYTVHTPQGPQERPLPQGQYKEHPNHVRTADGSVHVYAPVSEAAPEMARLMEELRTPEFEEAHPIVQAAYAHYCFVAIHPFADGNGRVARAFGSIFTYRGCRVPFYVFADERDRYFDCLAEADQGNYQPFTDFVLHWTLQALTYMTHELGAAAAAPAPKTAREVRRLLHARGGLSHTELDGLCVKFRQHLQNVLQAKVAEADVGPGVNLGVWAGDIPAPEVEGYRSPQGGTARAGAVGLSFGVSHPVEVKMQVRRPILIARDPEVFYDLIVVTEDGNRELGTMVVDLNEGNQLTPTTSASINIDAWARRLVNETLATFGQQMDEELHAAGWISDPDPT